MPQKRKGKKKNKKNTRKTVAVQLSAQCGEHYLPVSWLPPMDRPHILCLERRREGFYRQIALKMAAQGGVGGFQTACPGVCSGKATLVYPLLPRLHDGRSGQTHVNSLRSHVCRHTTHKKKMHADTHKHTGVCLHTHKHTHTKSGVHFQGHLTTH